MMQMLIMVQVSRPNAITNIEEENKELMWGGGFRAATGSVPNPTIDPLGWADRMPRGVLLITVAVFDSPATSPFSTRQHCFAIDILTVLARTRTSTSIICSLYSKLKSIHHLTSTISSLPANEFLSHIAQHGTDGRRRADRIDQGELGRSTRLRHD